jgi:lycopene cyclase domain-containing protein
MRNSMLGIDLSRLIYIFMEAYIIGGVALVLWAFHFRFLWRHRKAITLGTLIVTAYALPLDAIAVAHGWGWFNPTYVSGIYFFGRSLLLEEILFWLGTSFVTISAVLIFAELERRGTPRWLLAAGVFLPIEIFDSLIRRRSTQAAPSSEEHSNRGG